MSIKFWNASQAEPRRSQTLGSVSDVDEFSPNSNDRSPLQAAGTAQPVVSLCYWDLISLQENVRMVRQAVDGMDATLKKAIRVNRI